MLERLITPPEGDTPNRSSLRVPPIGRRRILAIAGAADRRETTFLLLDSDLMSLLFVYALGFPF